MKTLAIGLVGSPASGKSTIASDLQRRGFVYYSLSQTLRDVATILALDDNRKTLFGISSALREKFGDDILARRAKIWIESSGTQKVVIDSVRSPGEVRFLKTELGAFILGLSMPPEIRFRMLKERGRPGDPTTWQEFTNLINLEETDGSRVQAERCLELADAVIENDGLTSLTPKLDKILFTTMLEGNYTHREKL